MRSAKQWNTTPLAALRSLAYAAVVCALAGCTANTLQSYWRRIEHGDTTAREQVKAELPTARGKAAFWAALSLDPNVAGDPSGTDPMLAAALYWEAYRSGIAQSGYNLALLALNQDVDLEAARMRPLPGSRDRAAPPSQPVASLLLEAAKAGCVQAMIVEGQSLKTTNPVRAADYFEQASRASKAPIAERELGKMLLDGRGRPRNVKLGLDLLISAASGGDAEAAYTLASKTSSRDLKARWLGVAASLSPRYKAEAAQAMQALSNAEIVSVDQAMRVWNQAYADPKDSVDVTRPWRP